MYLTVFPFMIRKELDYKSFDEFLNTNSNKNKNPKPTQMTDDEILNKVKKLNF